MKVEVPKLAVAIVNGFLMFAVSVIVVIAATGEAKAVTWDDQDCYRAPWTCTVDTETEAYSNCNPFLARQRAQEIATQKLEARGGEVYDCDPHSGNYYLLQGQWVRGTYRTTHNCPEWTNPNSGLSNRGAYWTVVEICFAR